MVDSGSSPAAAANHGDVEPDISVVIPCHDGVRDTRACLEALHEQVGFRVAGDRTEAQESAPLPTLEIVIVDNGSSDGTRFLDQEFPEIHLLRADTNLGFAAGVNLGIQAARGERVLILNNDTMPAPNMVHRLDDALSSDTRIGAVAPTSNHVKGPARIDVGDLGATTCGRRGIESVLSESAEHTALQDTDTLSGLALLMRRDVFHQFHGFDDRFGLGMFEDDDLCLRMRLEGFRLVIVRDAFVHHRGHSTFKRLGHDVRETLEARKATFAEKWDSHPAGQAYLARLDHDSAASVDAAERALKQHPEWPDAHAVLAEAAYAKRDAEAMRRHADQFLASCPSHGRMAVLRSLGRLGCGEKKAGIEAFQQAISECHFNPDELADALAAYGRFFLEQGDAEAAHPHLQSALELSPERTDIQHLLGAAWIHVERFADALPLFEDAASEGDPNARNNAGICAWNLGDTARAIYEFERAVAACPDNQSYRDNLDQLRGLSSG